ncbi:hypothetical protein IW261DRAFT_1670915 [Armillaria novae-zelandiae]|uniref:Uncharacterized protein n=1 Tax=Armillaria novae-zelandiae TaxID=153914 RepID=A0AA39T8B7_9AGAR|nr:hypothetical protein IW261DRAFT_1670915 [Armillaria novae-zelandiae]
MVLMSTLQQFHEYWWGKDDFIIANTVIHFPAFPNFSFCGYRLLVREEYIYLFERLQTFSQYGRNYVRAVIVDGHSGVGKSMFLFYALVRCLQESRDVVFYFYHQVVHFSKDGAKEIYENLYEFICAPIWCLMDSYNGECPPIELTHHGYILPIFASSRPEELYSHWADIRCPYRLVMNPWSEQEIYMGMNLLDVDQNTFDLYRSQLPQVLGYCGHIIRDIYSVFFTYGSGAVKHLYNHHRHVSNLASLIQVLLGFHNERTIPPRRPCPEALMYRHYAEWSDETYLDFRSPCLAQDVWEQLIHLGYEDAQACFSPFSSQPHETIAGRWLFQVIARKQMCRETTQSKPSPPLHEMKLVEGTRTPVFYSSATEILFDPRYFYIPRQVAHDLLFNGIFFGDDPWHNVSDSNTATPDPTVLYIVRIAAEFENEGTEQGVEVICEILRLYPGLVPVYLFVVPLGKPNPFRFMIRDPERTWTMSQVLLIETTVLLLRPKVRQG